MKQIDDTIAAIATPIGEGGISVIRVSGKGAIELVDKGFRGRSLLKDAHSHTAHYGTFVDPNGESIDEVVATVFRSPNSYTAEDVVELSCHGGMFVTRNLLEAVIAGGARLADPGEFTKRAFLNGRVDLSQAEAVADLIQARSELARRNSLVQLQGSLSTTINAIVDKLFHLCGLVELELDFVEENIQLTSTKTLRDEIQLIVSELNFLIHSFTYGKLFREGVKVVLVGRPNAGKSSLLNTLLDQNRAIVTEIPGTTRDIIEENITLNGVLFRLVDTAGIRETSDIIEMEGVNRTKEQIRQADVCLFVVDLAEADLKQDIEFIESVHILLNGSEPASILLGNKVDLVTSNAAIDKLSQYPFPAEAKYAVSSKSKQGIAELTKGIVSACFAGQATSSETSPTVTNERHKRELENAVKSLNLALKSINESQSGEVIALDLRGALDALGSIVGTVTTDDILNSIFSKFCIGK
jgi:tRNA modification GTPase